MRVTNGSCRIGSTIHLARRPNPVAVAHDMCATDMAQSTFIVSHSLIIILYIKFITFKRDVLLVQVFQQQSRLIDFES